MAAAIGLALAPLLQGFIQPPRPPPSPLDIMLPVALVGGAVVVFLVLNKKNGVYTGAVRQAQGGLLSSNR